MDHGRNVLCVQILKAHLCWSSGNVYKQMDTCIGAREAGPWTHVS